MWINNQNFPVINNANIEEKYRVKNAPALWKFVANLNLSSGFEVCMIDYFKKNGISPAEFGKIVGTKYADTWNKSAVYKDLISNFSSFFKNISTYVEIMERTEITFKVKILPPIVTSWDVTREEFDIFCKNMWTQIADRMESDFTLTDDGQYWTIVMNKK